MKANCKKCKHCLQVRGREVICQRFFADGVQIDGFMKALGTIPIPTYCVYYEKRGKKYNGWSLQ